MRKLRTGVKECSLNEDLIVYPNGVTILVACEFNVYNLSEVSIRIQLNEEGDILELEPEEGFSTAQPVTHARILTAGAIVKYSYWL